MTSKKTDKPELASHSGHSEHTRVTDIMTASEHRAQFVELTLRNRDNESSRQLLEQEWRYIGPLVASLPAGARVLDLACGSGPHSLAWAERGYHVFGIDFDGDLLAAGRERVASAAPEAPVPAWVRGDATILPFSSGSFDIVFCNSLLEHVPAWESVLSETARVLRPGALFVMYTTNRGCPLQQEVNHFPFYSWLPDPIQRRVLAWIMKHRRDLVNFTDFPAVNWFTFPAMSRAFRAHGLEAYDRLDLLARGGAGGGKGAVLRLMTRLPLLKWPYYLYAISMALYGVKGRRA